MSRILRKQSATGVYHVVIRGNDKQIIFEQKQDYQKYLKILEHYKAECHFKIYAYCLMNNHIHLLIYTPHTQISEVIHNISTNYAKWFNAKYDRCGHLQQNRFYSEPVETTKYFFLVFRYIHQNPIKAGLESSVGERYPWSSIHAYKNEDSHFIDTLQAFQLFGCIENIMKYLQVESKIKCLDIDSCRKRMTDDFALERLFDLANCNSLNEFNDLQEEEKIKYVTILHSEGSSIRQIHRLTGLSRYMLLEKYSI